MKLLILALSDFNEHIKQDLENELYWIQKFYGVKAKLIDFEKATEELETNYSKYFDIVMEDENGGVWVELGEIKEALRRVVDG